MKNVFIVALTLFALAQAPAASSAEYTYLEAAYSTVDVRDYSYDQVSFKGSYALTDWAFVKGGYSNSDDSDFGVGQAKLGIGVNGAATENTDVFALLQGAIAVDSRGDFDKYTYELEVGAATQVLDRLEVRGGLLVTDITNSASFLGTVGTEYAITDSFRVGLDVFGKENVLGATTGVRWYF